jgi:hypothetical protein
MKPAYSVALLLAFILATGSAQTPTIQLTMEQVMTEKEIHETGVSTLTVTQRRALDVWLTSYTTRVLNAALNSDANDSKPSHERSSCSPAIETRIAGDIEGWEGETVFKLDNGQIWEQAAYAYTYFYAFRPEVTIYQTSLGCRMKVEDEDETVLVRRIK